MIDSGEFAPFVHTPGKVDEIIESEFLFQSLNGNLASDAFLTINDHRFVAWNGINPLKNFIQWDKRTADIIMFMFVSMHFQYNIISQY